MVVTTVRKSLVTVLMVLALLAGLITGFAHTKAVAMPNSTGIRTNHGQIAGYCPAPPKVCMIVK